MYTCSLTTFLNLQPSAITSLTYNLLQFHPLNSIKKSKQINKMRMIMMTSLHISYQLLSNKLLQNLVT